MVNVKTKYVLLIRAKSSGYRNAYNIVLPIEDSTNIIFTSENSGKSPQGQQICKSKKTFESMILDAISLRLK